MLQAIIDNKAYDFKVIEFSDGARSVVAPKLPQEYDSATLVIKDYPADAYLNLIMQAGDILEHNSSAEYCELKLNLPYLPYARADRRFGSAYSNPLQMFLRTLSDLPVDHLVLTDPHNLQAVKDYAEIPRLTVLTQAHCFKDTVNRHKGLKTLVKDYNPVFVAPDKGAWEKTKSIADEFGKDYALCEKRRNPHNGYITGLDLMTGSDVAGRHVIIPDDICDGGATFNIAAQALRKAGALSVTLYVTHGIFSKGINSLEVDAVYSYQKVNV